MYVQLGAEIDSRLGCHHICMQSVAFNNPRQFIDTWILLSATYPCFHSFPVSLWTHGQIAGVRHWQLRQPWPVHPTQRVHKTPPAGTGLYHATASLSHHDMFLYASGGQP